MLLAARLRVLAPGRGTHAQEQLFCGQLFAVKELQNTNKSGDNHHGCGGLRLIHSSLESLRADTLRGDYVNDSTPTCQAISINRIQEALRYALEQLIWIHVRSPKRFTYSHKLIRCSPSAGEIVRDGLRSDEIV